MGPKVSIKVEPPKVVRPKKKRTKQDDQTSKTDAVERLDRLG